MNVIIDNIISAHSKKISASRSKLRTLKVPKLRSRSKIQNGSKLSLKCVFMKSRSGVLNLVLLKNSIEQHM